MYLSYEEYQNMGGTLDETTFNSMCFEAGAFIDWVTFDRLKRMEEQPEALKRCMYELIKFVQNKQTLMMPSSANGSDGVSAGATVSSMSNDGVSVSYNVVSANELFSKYKSEMTETVKMYLRNVTNELGQNVLYRGRYANE